jgi:hypothetical protein
VLELVDLDGDEDDVIAGLLVVEPVAPTDARLRRLSLSFGPVSASRIDGR